MKVFGGSRLASPFRQSFLGSSSLQVWYVSSFTRYIFSRPESLKPSQFKAAIHARNVSQLFSTAHGLTYVFMASIYLSLGPYRIFLSFSNPVYSPEASRGSNRPR